MPHHFFSFIHKKIGGAMSGGSTGSASQPSSTQVQPIPVGLAGGNFLDVYECAKMNKDWAKVSNALKAHPDWLTRVPEGRRWTMLHQIVFAGDVAHLREILGFQLDNAEFRLLHKALDNKTVREVAMDRAHINPQMIRYIERLVAGDQILGNAKEGKLQLVTQVISTQKDLVNEKPPYRRHYLAHLLASMGRLDMFKAVNDISKFRLDLLVDNKSISQIARENNHPEFAEFVETLQATASPLPSGAATGSSASAHHSGQPQYSPGFHDDISISIIPAGMSFGTASFPASSGHSSSAYHHNAGHNAHFASHSMFHGHNPAPPPTSVPATTTSGASGDASDTSIFQTMTEDEQTAYESAVESSLKKLPGPNLLASITCCITKSIFRDPVVAADGFTYEREAITKWFETSTRSPTTNQELANLDLKPNYAIRSILQSLQSTNEPATKPKTKDPHAK